MEGTKTLEPDQKKVRRLGAFEPLRERAFRTIWLSSLVSNFGILILGVGAAWEMTHIANSPSMIALVQSALMLPSFLVSVPAGALADMFDRRKVALIGLGFACLCSVVLTLLVTFGFATPWLLLIFCSLVGAGGSLYSPAWQASVREQVEPEHLPGAIALSSISYNIARSFGPALGGIVVLLAGARAAFGVNAVCYVPLIFAFFLWRRPHVPSRLPPERIDRAIISGARYAIHAPSIRTVTIRSFAVGIAGASISALAPIVARDLLKGDAGTYGLLLGFFGCGSIAGALLIPRVREAMTGENAVRLSATVVGLMVVIVGLSRNVILTSTALLVAGVAWMLLGGMLNVGVQMSAPRWVTARALSWYQSSLTGGIAIGAWIWGHVAGQIGVGGALVASGLTMMLTLLLGLLLPMPRVSQHEIEMVEVPNEPEVALALTVRSGPVVIELDYRVDPDRARQFYGAMLKLQSARHRGGAFEWSLARDIADAAKWTERYHYATWGDYLRQRSRLTQADLALQAAANAFLMEGEKTRVRRRLERPFGSVRWRADSPDPQSDAIVINTP